MGEHRYIMEIYLGRKLTKDEVVHHINGLGTDNRIENLTVMSKVDHDRLPRGGEGENSLFYKHIWIEEKVMNYMEGR